MSETLQAISRALSADVQTLATISNNVANMNTPGFRSMRAIPGFGEQLQLRTLPERGDGALQQTGRSLDLALRGSGFFVVMRADAPLLTRAGEFRIDGDGHLVTGAGDRVVGLSGAIALPEGEVRVDRQGQIWSGDRPLDRLQMVDVGDASRLRPLGGGAYAYDGALVAWEGSVMQGAIERSNVDPAEQTVRLMETTRHAESLQRAISIYDQAMGTGISGLGDGQ